MEPINVNEHDYELEIKSLSEQFTFLKTSTEEELDRIDTEISQKYTPKYLDSICILLGIYSVYELIFSFFIKINADSFILSFFALNIITGLGVLIYLCCELIEYYKLFCDVTPSDSSFIKDSKTAAIFSAISLIFALLFPVLNKIFIPIIPYSTQIATIHFYIGLLLPFTGFILYWIYIQKLSQKAKQLITKRLESKKQNFNTLHDRKTEIDIILTEFNNNTIKK